MPWIRLTPRNLLSLRPELIEVVGNPELEGLVIPSGWPSASHVAVQNNARLRELDFSSVESIDLLSIENNPELGAVDLGALTRVDSLSVIDNPRLAPASFDAVQTLDRQMSGNATP